MLVLTNPIQQRIQESLESSDKVSIAVPFISFTAVKRLFDSDRMLLLENKRIVIKLDESHSITYDLAAIKHLLRCGFKVRFDNTIHLKLYILGGDIYISSGNLTDGGLINNFELTVQTTQKESDVQKIFDDLWERSVLNEVDLAYIGSNWEKYLFLKKKYPHVKPITPILNEITLSIDEEKLVDLILFENKDRSKHINLIGIVNRQRSEFMSRLKKDGFKVDDFYAIEGHPNRKKSLFYEFVYGNEEKLAGTGLRESQFKDVFTSAQFKEVIFYIYPQFKQSAYSWDLSNREENLNFCIGLFEFEIKSFKESLPIRMANYFYPEFFLPIFKLSHLADICRILGFDNNSNDPAIRFFEYNSFLRDRLKDVPQPNFIKSHILYKLLYSMILKREIEHNGSINIEKFIESQNKEWIRNTMKDGLQLLEENQSKKSTS